MDEQPHVDRYVHLHVHTEYSLLDGYGHVKEFAQTAAKLGQPALAITDHGSASGIFKFWKACQGVGIKPILGAELYMVDDNTVKPRSKEEIDRILIGYDKNLHKSIREKIKEEDVRKKQRDHITLLVQNKQGYTNLMAIIADSYIKGAIQGGYGRIIGRCDWNSLREHNAGLICMTACRSGIVAKPVLDKDIPLAETRLHILQTMFGDRLYIEIMPLASWDQRTVNTAMVNLAAQTGTELVATNDCHYPNKEDNETQDVLLATQSGRALNDPECWRFDDRDLYLKTREEMIASFAKRDKDIADNVIERALDNTIVIADRIEFELDKAEQRLPPLDINQREDYMSFKKWQQEGAVLPIMERIAALSGGENGK